MNVFTTSHTLTHSLSPPFSTPHFHALTSLLCRTVTVSTTHSLHPPRRVHLLRRPQNPHFKAVRCSMQESKFLEAEDALLLVATCVTRTLPPALTLQHGLDKIEEAVEELRLNPPCSTSGMYRFQVAVPPSAKALNWFCCQPEGPGVFPQFFLSKATEDPTCKSLHLNRTRGVFGIGSAVYFKGSFSCASAEWGSMKRYLSADSTLVMAYGFLDINFDAMSYSMKHETGSFYLFIPLIELDEFEGISILAATLAWNDSLHTFDEAIQLYKLSLYQARHHFGPIREKCQNKYLSSALRKFSMVEDKNVQMVGIQAFLLGGRDVGADPMEMVSPLS